MTPEIPRSPRSTVDPEAALGGRIARTVVRARLVGAVEAGWRLLLPILWVGGLWVAVSWLGIWAAVPAIVRLGLLAGFAVLLGLAVATAWRGRHTVAAAFDRGAAIRRIEGVSGLSGHELAGLDDRLAVAEDPATAALWAAHRRRLAARIGRLATGLPHPDLGRRDRWALRPILGLLLFVGWFAADGEKVARLGEAFRGPVAPSSEDRLDAWVDPPAYTGRPPLVLIAEGRPTGAVAAEGAVEVPQGSRLVVRAAGGRTDRAAEPVEVTLLGPDGRPLARALPPASEPAKAAPDDGGGRRQETAGAPVERTAILDRDAEVRLDRGGARLAAWRITVTPDLPPTIRLLGSPEPQMSGALKILHETADDWGVASAEARFEPASKEAPAEARALYAPPSFPLALPLGRSHVGKSRTLRDVTAHPFAGAAMRMTLVARDEAGQEGRSETVDVVLPERPFRKPLARALIELRRRLALDAAAVSTVVSALDALMLAPDRFATTPAVQLGLRFVLRRAAAARGDDDLREVVDLLWVAATSIEDGDLASQEKALRDAQEALRKALEEGASPQEIERLTQELRKAMDSWLAAMAEQARRNPQSRADRGGPQRTITDRDIQRMLDRIESLAKTGSREAAEQLLQELREMMENLQSGSPSQSAEGQAAGEALEKLGEMIRRQQKLMDDTHRSMRGEEGSDPGGETGGKGMGKLGEGQNALREMLKRFSDDMRGAGRPTPGGRSGSGAPGGSDDGAKEFDEADGAMGEAGEALGDGAGEDALEAQTRALDALRRGARKLADRMMPGGGSGRTGEREGGEDPLGRPRRAHGPSDGDRVKVPEEIDVERARRILEDIRRRLAEPTRPRFERDYLDRLQKVD